MEEMADDRFRPATPAQSALWAATYRGNCTPETAVTAIEAVSAELGMRCRRRVLHGSAVEIKALQEASWVRVITRRLPQRILWRVESEGDALAVTADFRAFRWFWGLVLGLFVCGLGLPVGSFWALGQPWAERLPLLRLLLGAVSLLAPLMVVAIPGLLGVLGGGRVAMSVWQPVLERVEKSGGLLEPVGSGLSRRYVASLAAMTLLLIAAVSPLLWLGLRDLGWYGSGTLFFLALLVGLGGLALLGAGVLARRRGAGLRAEPVLVGVVSSASVLFLLLPVLLLGLAGFEAATLETIGWSEEAAGWGSMILVFLGVIVSVGVFLTGSGIRLSVPGWVALERLQRHRGRGVYRQAVGGGALLRLVRRVFVALWGLTALFLVAGLGVTGSIAIRSWGPLSAATEVSVADILAAAVAFVVGRPWNDPALSTAFRFAFLLYSLGLGGIFILSVGQLWRSRRVTRRSLRAAALEDSPEHRRVQELTAQVCPQAGLAPVRLAVTSERAIEAYSHVFGLLGRERFLEISGGALRHLGDEELRALIAHELAHHLRGHLATHNRLRWLGRLTFVGDGFVRALLDSFGYETEADRVAVRELGARPEALLRCLWKIRSVNRFAGQGSRRIPDGLPAALVRPLETSGDWRKLLSEELQRLSLAQRWRLAWRLFLRQYFVPMPLHYWHPGHGDREAALRAMMESETHG
jgi:Zn-dependent protease with chaperone function